MVDMPVSFPGKCYGMLNSKIKIWFQVILSLVILSNALAERIWYVRSMNSSPQSCFSQSCLTLDMYAQEAATYFITGSTFIFMAGNHSIKTAINLADVSNVTFKGENSSNTFILCKNSVTIQSNNVTNLLLENMAFTLFPSNHFSEPSALKITNCRDVQMYQLIFRGTGTINRENTSRAISITNSSLTATSCLFEGNSGNDGGAIYALAKSTITLKGNVFHGNVAKFKGGAIFTKDSVVSIYGTLSNNFSKIGNDDWPNLLLDGVTVRMLETLGMGYFGDNVASDGGALYVYNSNVTFSGTTIIFRNNSAGNNGGGIYNDFLSQVIADPHHFYLIENRAKHSGGAIHSCDSKLLLGTGTGTRNLFLRNLAENGGGIYSKYLIKKELVLAGESCFASNHASSKGGAIFLNHGIFTLESHNALFTNNTAVQGGALYLAVSYMEINGNSTIFESNSAKDGAAIYSAESGLVATEPTTASAMLSFIGNVASNRGGGVYASNYNNRSRQVIISAQFINNTAHGCGGAFYMSTLGNAHLINVTALGNAESALCILESRVTFGGPTTNFSSNTGKLGGAIQIISSASTLSFQSYVFFNSNRAVIGGAIYSPYETSIEFNGRTIFTNNMADKGGGALYALSTNISFNVNRQHVISFEHNLAENGGAIFLGGAAFMRFAKGAFLNTSLNHAHQYGGAIYYEDTGIPIQCSFELEDEAAIMVLPYCFMRFTVHYLRSRHDLHVIGYVQSYYDSAGIDGRFVYGGLLDRCQLAIDTFGEPSMSIVPYDIFQKFFEVHKPSNNITTRGITSKSYQLCFCEDNEVHNCLGTRYIKTYRGQRFSLSLVALDQIRNPTKTQIMAKIGQNARLEVNQSSQPLEEQCFKLSYNLYSSQDYEELILYPDGPCRDTGLATAIVNVTFLPCPDGFEKSSERCVCEARLQNYGADCTIDKDVTILRKQGSTFWVSGLYRNDTYLGLILYKTCPSPYCKNDDQTLSIDNPDIQCANNRSGILCGACATNYSFMLGSSRCEECSNTYLALLLPFAAAGIALVVFLSLLRLTVANGMINSVILYANIVQVNKRLFLPSEARNVLTVFIAWLNLDFGFETCFYDGMNAYAQTWLQFAFPLYVWILISLIILVSRYSVTVSKLIGHNPIAVLATLLLMSYTKVLNIVIETYSFANLDYPGSKTVAVWLKDANVPYFVSGHLLLTVVTTLILVFLFLPYTFLLLLGYKLYRFSPFCLINRLKPLLDSYYAPYNKHTRYWTGFLLLVRCALYIVFSLNSLGATSGSLLAINTTFTAIVIIAWLSTRIYKSLIVNIVEASVYLNLVILSAATSNDLNSTGLVYTLVAIVFVTMIGIILYHFHITYTAKSALSKMVTTRISEFRSKLLRSPDTIPPVDTPAARTPQDSERIVTKTVIELREPLLQ